MKNYKEILNEGLELNEAVDKHWMVRFKNIDFWVKNSGTKKWAKKKDKIGDELYNSVTKAVINTIGKDQKQLGIDYEDIKSIIIELNK